MCEKNALAGILGLLVLCLGCTLPCHPFDYNGPVYDDCGNCISNSRAASILEIDGCCVSPLDGQNMPNETTPDIQEQTSEYDGPDSYTNVISITDRKVEGPETTANPEAEAAKSGPVLAQPTTANFRWR